MQQNVIDGALVDQANNSLNSRGLFFAPDGCGMRDIVLSYPQWYFAGDETDWPQPYTINAAIEYPIGHFTAVYHNGVRSLTVTPGLGQIAFDPCPITIPAGERFYVKTHASWIQGRFPLGSGTAVNWDAGEYCYLQTGAADLTLEVGQPGQTSFVAGFAPTIYGRLSEPLPTLGVIGDSIARAVGPDSGDPETNARFIRRAIGNAFPVLEVNCSGHSFAGYFTRHSGRDAMLLDRITHLLVGLGRNDLAGPFKAADVARGLQLCIAPYLERGVRCSAFTALPTSISSDGWSTVNRQVAADPCAERERVAYNGWLRSKWRALGLSGIFDIAAAVEDGASGLWRSDGVSGHSAAGYAVLSGGVVRRVRLGIGGGGAGYPASTQVRCAVVRQKGDFSGRDALIVANTDMHGFVNSFTVEDGGRDYTKPPWIAPLGAWTNDGVHPDKRGYDEIIVRAGIGPAAFVL